MKTLLNITMLLFFISCQTKGKQNSIQFISDSAIQANLFNDLLKVTPPNVLHGKLNDSIAFLILPLQASCPACRKKTIDSIMRHQEQLDENHFVIISGAGGRKIMNAFFKEQNYELPFHDRILLDTLNTAYKINLFESNTAFYYAYNRKVYKKVSAIPATVKNDLREFFSN